MEASGDLLRNPSYRCANLLAFFRQGDRAAFKLFADKQIVVAWAPGPWEYAADDDHGPGAHAIGVIVRSFAPETVYRPRSLGHMISRQEGELHVLRNFTSPTPGQQNHRHSRGLLIYCESRNLCSTLVRG